MKAKNLLVQALEKFQKKYPEMRATLNNPYFLEFYLYYVNKKFNKLYNKYRRIK